MNVDSPINVVDSDVVGKGLWLGLVTASVA